ncbi:ATP-binding protein [Actinacidiphila rubida]|uniref:Anti-sigma regulatory factor (Ser/Thr protein kinase) n=1 Tax=Actinacidiphila rubida TaxID=310780 RepID=A0A1H8LMD9_9ACTN|nr:ATP-binding protein [Actinacidiphila rubida]SEO06321.1 Anti-sigma regulatory factor (Ser/Thr protein kinase) [Actinacidiphila rubida]
MAYVTAGRGREGSPRSGLRAGAAYDGGTESIADARLLAREFLDQVRESGIRVPAATVSEAQLVVSELVTNACKYAPGPSALSLEVRGTVLEITLWDSEPVLPMARAAEPGRIGQHGLEIVFALCEGFDVQREPVGKRITVRLALHARGAW